MPDGARHGLDHSLTTLRQAARDQLGHCDDVTARRQYHPDLSPLSWHLGHVFFVETYWLREVICGDAKATTAWHDLFFPERNAKPSRRHRLPPLADILDWTHELEADNQYWWQTAANSDHRLMTDSYLSAFLAQHYAQHLETMNLVHRQRALTEDNAATPIVLTTAISNSPATTEVLGGSSHIGNDLPHAYDNEQPAHVRRFEGFRIANAPVTNAEWLAFIEDDGYNRDALWTDDGRSWRDRVGAQAPQHWQPHPGGGWYSPDAAEPLRPEAPVHGICAHEADAFAYWAGARLPHEHEHEYAVRTGVIPACSEVWEWAGNTLFPYPGFRAFPYEGYSMPWFDGGHRVCRGASQHTHPLVHRPSFRNFFPETHRHIRAGLRLAWS